MISLTRAAPPCGRASVSSGGYGGASGNTSVRPAQFVTTVRPADTLKDAVSNRSLQDGPRCRGGSAETGRAPRIDGNVNYGSNGEEALARHDPR